MSARGAAWALWLFGASVVLAFACKPIWPEAALYRDVLGEGTLLSLGAIAKLAFLAIATTFLALSARLLERENPARLPWTLLSLGIAGFLAGQSFLGVYQLVLRQPSPFPSAADVLFVGAYPFLIVGLIAFVRAYREAGYPVGTTREHALLAGLGALLFAVPCYRLVKPILAAPASPLEHALNAGYPLLDVLVLLPILVLMRIAARFRGGKVARVWAALLAGFLCLAAADILFAYFSVLGQKALDPLVDATFVLAYLFLAAGARDQYRLLTE